MKNLKRGLALLLAMIVALTALAACSPKEEKTEEKPADTAKTEENYSKDNNKISDGAVIAIVFSVIILGFAGLVFISRK